MLALVIPDVPQWVQDEMARQQYKAQLALRVSPSRSLKRLKLLNPHFDVISDLSLNRRTTTWNLFFKQAMKN